MKTVFLFSLFFIPSILHAFEDPVIQKIDPFYYAHMNFQRDWSYVAEARNIFLKECRLQNIKPEHSDSLFLIVYNSEIPLWGFGFKVDDTLITRLPIKKSKYDYSLIAKYTFTGLDQDIYNSVQHFNVDINSKEYTSIGPLIITWPTSSGTINTGISQHEFLWPVKTREKEKIHVDYLYTIINFLIVFQFLFFGIYLITYKKGKPISNLLFATFLFANALVFLNNIFYYYQSGIMKLSPHLFEVGSSFMFLVPPALYFYTISILYYDFKFAKVHLIHLIPFILDFIFVSFKFHFHNSDLKRELLVMGSVYTETEFWIRSNVLHFLVFGYIIAALIAIRKYRMKILNTFSYKERIGMSWLSSILIWYFLIEFIYTTKHLVFLAVGHYYEILIAIAKCSYLAFSVFVVYKGLKQPEIFNGIEENGKKQKYKKYLLAESQREYYLQKLLAYMEAEKPYLNPFLSMPELAEKIPMTPHYLSQIINDSLNKNFFDFINSYRIRESQKLLMDMSNHKRTILNILYETGFNSKSVFNESFKKHTGMTPSEFRRQYSKVS